MSDEVKWAFSLTFEINADDWFSITVVWPRGEQNHDLRRWSIRRPFKLQGMYAD